MFWSLFIFHEHSTRETASIVCDEQGDLFILWADTGTALATAKTLKGLWRQLTREKLGRGFRECTALLWPTPHFKGRTFQLWVLNKRIFNFCVRSIPLRGGIALCVFWLFPLLKDELSEGEVFSCPKPRQSGEFLADSNPRRWLPEGIFQSAQARAKLHQCRRRLLWGKTVRDIFIWSIVLGHISYL